MLANRMALPDVSRDEVIATHLILTFNSFVDETDETTMQGFLQSLNASIAYFCSN